MIKRLMLWVMVLWGAVGCNSPSIVPTQTPILRLPITIQPHNDTPTPPTPTQTLESTPVPSRCPSAPPARLIVQERGKVTENNQRLNIREGPGTEFDILTLLEAGTIFFVIDGPACSGGFTWFRIRYQGVSGWIAEGDTQEYYAQPYLTG